MPCDEAALRFGDVWPVLSRSVRRDSCDSPSAICAKVCAGLAVIAEIHGGQGYALLEVMQYPVKRVLHISHVAGDNMAEWLQDGIAWWKQYAAEQGCDAVRYHGRKGWARLVPEFQEVATVYEIDLRACQ
jgi:hypothetical protein